MLIIFTEDAERKLQQASVQCVTPISPLEGQMLDLNAVEFGNLEGFPNNVGEDAEFHSWYWYVDFALQFGYNADCISLLINDVYSLVII